MMGPGINRSVNKLSWIPMLLNVLAEPIFGKSNLIFTLVAADGLLKIPPDPTGLSAGEIVGIVLI